MEPTRTRIRQNTIVFVTGPKGSGKSYALDKYFTAKHPRVIHLDFVGEIAEKYPDAIETIGFRETMEQLRAFAVANETEWNIVAVFPEHQWEELPDLFTALCPQYQGRHTPMSVSQAFGGIALECSECDIILPNNAARDGRAARNMIKRARHERLDLYLGTQRPQECSRLCTSQADFVIAFQMHEPRELDYLSRGVGSAFAERVRLLRQYHSLWFNRATHQIAERDAKGKWVTPDATAGEAI
jgi:hypothetical protein